MKVRFNLIPLALMIVMMCGQPASAQNQISGKDWMAAMVTTLPDFFCQTDQYFMQCFEVSQEDCRAVTKQETERCLGELAGQIPALLNMPDDGSKWGTDLGRCAGIGYDRQLAERKSAAPRCNMPSG